MSDFINISAYKFAPLAELASLRAELLPQCEAWDLKGTILLSPEGINLFISGLRDHVDGLVARLRTIPGFADLTPKLSASASQPFTRMLVRIKKEIIAFGKDSIQPHRYASPKLAPTELKRWLDEGRPLTLLDTRNDYEVELGTFHGAKALGIKHFRDFPAAVSSLVQPDHPIVTFCTGGIRCEKAGAFMEASGFKDVYQLDGGILKYFEECGGSHYTGDCFVFDKRVAVDPHLRETSHVLCFACLAPLPAKETQDPRYIEGESCPRCYVAEVLPVDQRQKLISAPFGSVPRDNRRPVTVTGAYDGVSLRTFIEHSLQFAHGYDWNEEFRAGRFLDAKGTPADPEGTVRSGERYFHLIPNDVEPPVANAIGVIYEDEALVVIDKPAPLPVHPSGRYLRNTLTSILNTAYAPYPLRSVHRLDANTSGVIIFARTKDDARHVQAQFARGEVEKFYRARVLGHPTWEHFTCSAAIGDGAGTAGARSIDEGGKPAQTHVRVLERRADGTSLVEARPVTGRTHQIRLHLWGLSLPIVGDPLYLPHGRIGVRQTLGLGETMGLVAHRVTLTHPRTGQRVSFSASLPGPLRE